MRGRPPADLRVAALFGITLGLMNWAIYSAMDRIPLGVAVTIEFAGPLGVAVFASRRPLDLLWVVLAAAGIVLLADPGGGSLDTVGVAFALLAAAMWAAYILLSVRTGRLFPGGSGLAIAMAVGAVTILPLGVGQAGSALLEPELLAAGAVVALASSVIPYSLELEALRRLPARVFGVLMSLEPAVAALAGLVVLGQALGAREWLAIALVVVAAAGATAPLADAGCRSCPCVCAVPSACQRVAGLVEREAALDRHPEDAGVQELGDALEVLGGRRGHHVRAPRAVAGRRQRRGAAAAGLQRGGVGVEAVRRVGDELEQGVDAVGVALAHGRRDVALARDQLADAEVAQVLLVLGQGGSDDRRAGVGGELDGEAADAAGRRRRSGRCRLRRCRARRARPAP